MPISFEVNSVEHDLIVKIARRADAEVFQPNGVEQTQLQTVMDLSACHATACPIDLAELLNAPAGDFAHDVAGIRRHIDRSRGILEDVFMPRYARQEQDAVSQGAGRRVNDGAQCDASQLLPVTS